jgi:hypothetical protein
MRGAAHTLHFKPTDASGPVPDCESTGGAPRSGGGASRQDQEVTRHTGACASPGRSGQSPCPSFAYSLAGRDFSLYLEFGNDTARVLEPSIDRPK